MEPNHLELLIRIDERTKNQEEMLKNHMDSSKENYKALSESIYKTNTKIDVINKWRYTVMGSAVLSIGAFFKSLAGH